MINDKVFEGISDKEWLKATSSNVNNKYNTEISPEMVPGLREAGFTYEEFL